MIKSVLVDDEPRSISILRKLLKQFCHEVIVCGEATDFIEAKTLILDKNPQLVFLDIEMPKGNAFDLLNELLPVTFEVIFVTAFNDYAIKAFRYSALDYLLKPVDIDALRNAVVKAEKRIHEKTIDQRLENFLGNFGRNVTNSRIALPTTDGMVFYATDDIIYCTSEGAYTRFNFVQSKSVLIPGLLKEFIEILPARRFCRIHNSFLINLDHVKKYYKGKGGYVEMTDGKKIGVSFRKREEFLKQFKHK